MNIDTLKIINVIELIIMSVTTYVSYEEVYHDKKSWMFGLIEIDEGFAPTKWWFISLFITVSLFVIGVGLGGEN
jgi:hypothetical protein